MKRAKSKGTSLTLLGRSKTKLPAAPSEARLETFPNPTRRNYHIHFETDDFTCLCPVTGQPDFARIDIDYVPDRLCVESKSLKFYLASYRNERAFNEAVTNRILEDFLKACAPRQANITAQFSARGGIALTVRADYPDAKIPNAGDERKSTRLNSSHVSISYAGFCLKTKNTDASRLQRKKAIGESIHGRPQLSEY